MRKGAEFSDRLPVNPSIADMRRSKILGQRHGKVSSVFVAGPGRWGVKEMRSEWLPSPAGGPS